MLCELHSLNLKLCRKQYNKKFVLHLIVAPQLGGGRQHNYSNKTRQAGCANEQSMYSLMSMAIRSSKVLCFLTIDIKERQTDKWHVLPALFVSLILLVAAAKKPKKPMEDVALGAGTYQNLSNLYSLDIYGVDIQILTKLENIGHSWLEHYIKMIFSTNCTSLENILGHYFKTLI